MRPFSAAVLIFLPISLGLLASDAGAQGRGRNNDAKHRGDVVQQSHPRKGKKVKVYTSDEATDITRIVLREQGYDVVRVERRGGARIVYYRRGNMGRGRGKGPVTYMVIRPGSERIVIERAPSPLLMQINVRLGY
jgi:hypothetical protein